MLDWIQAHARPIFDSVVYSILGSAILLLAFGVLARVLPFSMKKEIAEDQNVAFGIILGALVLGLSIIIATAIR